MTSNLLLTSEIQSQMNFALQNSFQAAKSQENNANSLRTAADQQRQSKQHTHVSPCISTVITNSSHQNSDIHNLTCTRLAVRNLLYFSQQMRKNIRKGKNQLTVLLQLLLLLSSSFALSRLSSIVTSRRIKSMIDCLLAC